MATTAAAASAPATQFWRERGPQEWARVLPTYWEAGGQLHRQAMLAALRSLPRFETVREVGCCAGTNVRLIREAFPWVAVEGTELSVEAATFAQDKLAKDPGVRIVCADLFDDAPLWESRGVDVALTCYTLAYVAPEEIEDVLFHLLRSASKGVVLVEPMFNGEPGRLPVQYTMEWRHGYLDLLSNLVVRQNRQATIDSIVLNEPVENCDGVAVVKFK